MSSFTAFVEASRGAQPHEYLVVNKGVIQKRESGTPSSKAENQAAWKCFQQVIQNIPRSQEICKRYKFHIPSHIAQGNPLLPEYVEMFGVGIADVHLKDLIQGPQDSLDALRRLSPQEFARKVEELNVGRFIPTQPARDRWHQFFFPDHFKKDQHRLRMQQEIPRLSERDAFLELLCKKIIQHDIDESTLVPVPSPNGGMEYYEVVKKIGTGAGLVAFMLKPVSKQSQLKPLLVFRPTQFHLSSEDAVPTLLNDLERNIGHTGYLAAKQTLARLMANPDYQDIEAVGFSLGGVHLQRFLVDHYDKVTRAVFFNDPSIDVHSAAEYAERVNRLPVDKKVSLVFYRTVGDRVHYFGHHHVGKGVSHPNIDMRLVDIYSDRRHVLSGRTLHSEPLLHDPSSYVAISHEGESLQVHLDSAQRGAEIEWYENLRQSWGVHMLFTFLELLYSMLKAILEFFGLEIFRSSFVPEDLELLYV